MCQPSAEIYSHAFASARNIGCRWIARSIFRLFGHWSCWVSRSRCALPVLIAAASSPDLVLGCYGSRSRFKGGPRQNGDDSRQGTRFCFAQAGVNYAHFGTRIFTGGRVQETSVRSNSPSRARRSFGQRLAGTYSSTTSARSGTSRTLPRYPRRLTSRTAPKRHQTPRHYLRNTTSTRSKSPRSVAGTTRFNGKHKRSLHAQKQRSRGRTIFAPATSC